MPSMYDIGTTAGTVAAGNDTRITGAGHIVAFNAGTSFSNTVSATSVLSGGPISGGWPVGTAIGDTVRIIATGYWLNNTGANQTWTWTLKSGSSTVGTGVTGAIGTQTNKRRWMLDITAIYLAIGTSSNVAVTGTVTLSSQTTSTFEVLQAAASTFWAGGTIVGSLNTSAGDTLDLLCTHSTATATSTSACEGITVLHFPKTT